MRNINKKIIAKSVFVIVLILSLSTITYAKPFTDAFRGGLLQINDFFAKEQYKPYSQVIDFFFFSLLFIAVYMMGVRYAFKEVKRPEQVIAILLGLMTAFLLVLGGFSATILIPYIHWLLYVLLFILYWWLLKGIKNKFWRFILALLLTLLTIALFQGLFDSLTAPDAEGFFKSLGKGFGAIQFPELPGPPGVPDLFGALPTVTTPTGPVTPTETPKGAPPAKEEKGGIFGTGASWWWVLVPLLLAGLGGLGYWQRDRLRGLFRRDERAPREGEQPRPPQPPPEELTIQKIINEIVEILKLKLEILKVIDGIVQYKKAKIKDLHDEYMKVLKYDESFWVDPDSEAFKSFLEQTHVVRAILKLEFDLEKLLIQLMEKENQLIGVGKYSNESSSRIGLGRRPLKIGLAGIWLRRVIELDRERARELIQELDRIEKEEPLLFWEKVKAKIEQWLISLRNAPYWYRDLMAKIYGIFFRLFSKSDGTTLGLCWAVKQKIAEYFIIGKNERYKLKAWEKLTEIKTLQKWYKDKSKWKTIDKTNPEAIKRHFENEEKFFFEQLRPAVLAQMKYMYLLIRYLKLFLANREKFTEMQELWVETPSFIDGAQEKRILTKEAAADPENFLLLGMPFRVATKLATGPIGQYAARFYIDGRIVLDPDGKPLTKPIEKTQANSFPTIELDSEEIYRYRSLLEGEHTITFYLIGAKEFESEYVPPGETPPTPIAQKWRDVKSIRIHIRRGPFGVRIIQPEREYVPRVRIGGFIDNLQAEALGPNSDAINSGSVRNIRFVWYVEQERILLTQDHPSIQRIHTGRTGPRNLATDTPSEPISQNIFVPGEAKLIVFLIDTNKRMIIGGDHILIDIVPREAEAPPKKSGVIIIKPAESATLMIGNYAEELEAEYFGSNSAAINDGTANIYFIWYLEQSIPLSDHPVLQRIHVGRMWSISNPMLRLIEEIAEPIWSHYKDKPYFVEGDAILSVTLYDATKHEMVDSASIKVKLKDEGMRANALAKDHSKWAERLAKLRSVGRDLLKKLEIMLWGALSILPIGALSPITRKFFDKALAQAFKELNAEFAGKSTQLTIEETKSWIIRFLERVIDMLPIGGIGPSREFFDKALAQAFKELNAEFAGKTITFTPQESVSLITKYLLTIVDFLMVNLPIDRFNPITERFFDKAIKEAFKELQEEENRLLINSFTKAARESATDKSKVGELVIAYDRIVKKLMRINLLIKEVKGIKDYVKDSQLIGLIDQLVQTEREMIVREMAASASETRDEEIEQVSGTHVLIESVNNARIEGLKEIKIDIRDTPIRAIGNVNPTIIKNYLWELYDIDGKEILGQRRENNWKACDGNNVVELGTDVILESGIYKLSLVGADDVYNPYRYAIDYVSIVVMDIVGMIKEEREFEETIAKEEGEIKEEIEEAKRSIRRMDNNAYRKKILSMTRALERERDAIKERVEKLRKRHAKILEKLVGRKQYMKLERAERKVQLISNSIISLLEKLDASLDKAKKTYKVEHINNARQAIKNLVIILAQPVQWASRNPIKPKTGAIAQPRLGEGTESPTSGADRLRRLADRLRGRRPPA